MSLADYLAKNYLNADAKPEKKNKKRKRKHADETTGVLIADDDTLGWANSTAVNDDEDLPTTVMGHSSEFRKTKKNNWKMFGNTAPTNAEQAAADAIIASAAAENSARQAEDDEGPDVVDNDKILRMDSGARAGLQTADQVAADIKKRQKDEQREFERTAKEWAGKGQETVYRDASGRIINVAMKRAEARKEAEEKERQRMEEQEANKGDVQRALKEQRKKELEDAKFMPLARGVDDESRNEELKAQDRWNDPAAQFISKKKSGKSITGKPLYKGAAPPNRYGIRPGHRWDGVDRGNGFEKKYFAAQNRRSNIKDLEYAWQMDV